MILLRIRVAQSVRVGGEHKGEGAHLGPPHRVGRRLRERWKDLVQPLDDCEVGWLELAVSRARPP